ncbi:MAG: pitrilysin family protein [bacterium]|nr:pitrilysin family protein [bacterium]
MFQKQTLKNGLNIVTVPLQNTKTVTVLVMVKIGSRYENEENNGISHFLEHMFFKGTEKRPNTLALASEIDQIGGEHNAFTSKEYTGYYAKAGKKHLSLLLDLLSDMYFNSKLEPLEIEREKGVICEEINMYQDLPMQYVGVLWEKLLYGDCPSGWATIGSRENVQSLRRQDLVEYLEKGYVANNTFIFISGGIETDKAADQAKKYFQDARNGELPVLAGVTETQKIPQLLLQTKKTDQTHFCLGVRGYGAKHPDYYAAEVLTAILGGGMSSRLFIAVREKRGLAYYIHADFESYTDHGYFVAQAGVDNQKLEEAISVIIDECNRLKTEKLSEADLSRAQEYLKGKLILGLETSDEIAFWLSGQEIARGNMLAPGEIIKKIDAVGAEDVGRVAGDIFVNDKLNLAVIGPREGEKALREILKF